MDVYIQFNEYECRIRVGADVTPEGNANAF
jgi:hypothetical protein